MENRKALVFGSTIGAIILGVTLFKQFNFKSFEFEKPALAVVYMIGLVICILFIRKNTTNK